MVGMIVLMMRGLWSDSCVCSAAVSGRDGDMSVGSLCSVMLTSVEGGRATNVQEFACCGQHSVGHTRARRRTQRTESHM